MKKYIPLVIACLISACATQKKTPTPATSTVQLMRCAIYTIYAIPTDSLHYRLGVSADSITRPPKHVQYTRLTDSQKIALLPSIDADKFDALRNTVIELSENYPLAEVFAKISAFYDDNWANCNWPILTKEYIR